MSSKSQSVTFEENAAKVVSIVEQRKEKLTANELSMSIIRKFGQLANYCHPQPAIKGRDHVRIILGDILVCSIAQANISNGIASEAYKLTQDTVLPFGGAVVALMQSTFCQYRVHAATHDLEQMVLGNNMVGQNHFNILSHERAESVANLYKSLRTFAMDFDLDLEECLARSVKRLSQGVKIL